MLRSKFTGGQNRRSKIASVYNDLVCLLAHQIIEIIIEIIEPPRYQTFFPPFNY
jgi:hypothetical protein